ncbi:4-oxalocrotonate tautomerase [Desulfonispora thiosulfatigenes DSM 11270]|uniref:Tautomerase n=1 Tax=Desulfonispora thiosulfatigenes DSM 11270 TaxID=656914 RepID=A0A1W1VSD3_DESTI|nr:2-hydroxymuconate tautomerase [Desulfonispora thiosulfatigenes]SMB96130.1 4-oxalocrotonate tautomerase [Desulfonispora thiosulfatigenes DSM 11270]
MPIVQIDLLEGRTVEQKRELVTKVTEAISESVNCSKDNVTIILRDMPTHHLAKAGVLKCDE